ncbi:gas vesicle protein GvpG [Streptomyces sp. NBC_00859]|uniref:gas vesicle protein GvpG n=1 Tax=Streptomyces sp. NBC_00859 TaxID=2903682 RepID=UPI00386411E9|nr:gas vesicle protein GvpG [Streptomyces sp. NBC_00859]
MGLLSGVLLLPLAPVRGVMWVSDRLVDAAEQELYDPGVIRAQLAELNRSLDDGEIDLPQFEREEERLLDLLDRKLPAPARRTGGTPAHGTPIDGTPEGPPMNETEEPARTAPRTGGTQ